jgi:hypothetical protein
LCSEYLELHKRVREVSSTLNGLLHIYETLNGVIDEAKMRQFVKDNPDYDIHGINARFEKMYPILDHLSAYDYAPIVPMIAEYINLIDAAKENNNV